MQYILRARKSVVEANFHFHVPPSRTRSSPAVPGWLCKRVVIMSAALMPVSFRHVHTQTQLCTPTCHFLFTSYSSSRFQAFSPRAGRSARSYHFRRQFNERARLFWLQKTVLKAQTGQQLFYLTSVCTS